MSKSKPRLVFTKQALTGIRLTVSYIVLLIGSMFMLFPIVWMISASLKPEWQIFTRPIIWIPQDWLSVPAGTTGQSLQLWTAPGDDGRIDSLRLGVRRYTPVIRTSDLAEPFVVPVGQVSDAVLQQIGEVTLNVRRWQPEDRDVVALTRLDDDSLLVAPLEDKMVQALFMMPVDQMRSGTQGEYSYLDATLQTWTVTVEGTPETLIPLGPQIQLVTAIPAVAAESAQLVFQKRLGSPQSLPLGQTEVMQYTLTDDDSNARYLVLGEAAWQPVLPETFLRTHAFPVSADEISIIDKSRRFSDALFPVAIYTDARGNVREVALVHRNPETGNHLAIPTDQIDRVNVAPLDTLMRPFPKDIKGQVMRVKNYRFSDWDESRPVAIVGERQDMAMLIPVDAIPDAYDVLDQNFWRKTVPKPVFENYLTAMSREIGGYNFLTFFKNTLIVVVLSIVGHMISCSMAAYGFARLRAPGKKFWFGVLLATMMLPAPVRLVPEYEIFRELNMVNKLWPLFITTFFGNAFLIFLLRQFFATIPTELEDAARIDGAGYLDIFLRIILPLSTPALATVMIFTFLWSWNNLFGALIYLQSPQHYTVALGLSAFVGLYQTEYNLLMAASVIVMTPTVLVFFFAQRFFIEGITLTGIKG